MLAIEQRVSGSLSRFTVVTGESQLRRLDGAPDAVWRVAEAATVFVKSINEYMSE